jgi:hypothetical protein
VTDQTSIISFIEYNWGLGRIGDGSFDLYAGPLTNMFHFGGAPTPKLFLQPESGQINNPPVIDTAQISASHPRTNDVLTLNVSAHDADPSDTKLTFNYQWQKYTETGWTDLTGQTGATLDLGAPGTGDKGEQIRAEVTPDDGIQPGTTVATDPITVTNTAPQLHIQPTATKTQYSDHIDPISISSSDADGDAVTLTASGLPTGVSLQDHGDGTGTIMGAVTDPAGSYTFSVVGSDGTDTTTESTTIAVTKEDAAVVYTGSLFFSTGSTSATTASVTLSAKVSQADDGDPGDLAHARVLFDLYKSNNYYLGPPDLTVPATVDADGLASAAIGTLGTDNWTVIARIDPNNGYFAGPSSDAAVITVYQPSPDKFVTGGGWVHDPSSQDKPVAVGANDHGNFGFTVRYSKNLTPSGHAIYVFRGSDGFNYIVKSNSWQGGGLALGATSGRFGGKANVSVVDTKTGQIVDGLGGGNYSYRVDVTDGGVGAGDSYAITVYTPTGTLYHQVGMPQKQLPLEGGNIVIHS